MSYETEVLADTPALYYRLDMTGSANNGDSIPDSSGNGLDGDLVLALGTAGGPGVSPGDGVVPFSQPYGHTSPFETDGSSREFCGHNYNIFADKEDSRIVRTTDSLIEPATDFTLEAWVRPLRDDVGAVNEGTIAKPLRPTLRPSKYLPQGIAHALKLIKGNTDRLDDPKVGASARTEFIGRLRLRRVVGFATARPSRRHQCYKPRPPRRQLGPQ